MLVFGDLVGSFDSRYLRVHYGWSQSAFLRIVCVVLWVPLVLSAFRGCLFLLRFQDQFGRRPANQNLGKFLFLFRDLLGLVGVSPE